MDGLVTKKSLHLTFSSAIKVWAQMTFCDINIKLLPRLTDAQLLQKYNYITKKEKVNTLNS